MKTTTTRAMVTMVAVLAFLGMAAIAGDKYDKYALKVPGGLALSEFRGYEAWQVVSVSHSDETLNVIVANPEMIKAYQAGIPGNGKPFPNGAKTVKIQYVPKKSPEAPVNVAVPDKLRTVLFMVKDSNRFPTTGGWGYGTFNNDPTSGRLSPHGTDAKCGAACHTIVKGKDYVFTAYEPR